MSLDVYLNVNEPRLRPKTSGIFVREKGATREITREEWDRRNPGVDPVVFRASDEDEMTTEVYSANITHNLNQMAQAAQLYEALWHPEIPGYTKARQLIEPLRDGLDRLKRSPNHYRKFNPENGWGDYEGLVEFVKGYLAACEQYPDASVRVSV